jgi:hypothetical protein
MDSFDRIYLLIFLVLIMRYMVLGVGICLD